MLMATLAASSAVFGAVLVDELLPIYPDSTASELPILTQVSSARDTIAGFHLLLDGLDESQPAEVQVFLDDQPFDVKLYELIDVPVEVNTGLVTRTENYDKKKNPHVIRRAPFRIYEALKPVSDLDAGKAQAGLRVEWSTEGFAPGAYELTINLKNGSQVKTLDLDWHQFSVRTPPIERGRLRYTNWFNLRTIAKDHKVDWLSEEHWAMIDKYAALMARGRQDTFIVRWADFMDNELVLDKGSLKRLIQIFLDHGMRYPEGGHIAGRTGGDWGAKTFSLVKTGTLGSSDKGAAELKKMLGQVWDVVEEMQLDGVWLQHAADEPIDVNVDDYMKISDLVSDAMPGVRILEATMSQKLVGAVDVWCPQIQEFQAHKEWFEARQEAGDQVWVYTCLSPGGDWLNRLLDQERLREVYFGWGAATMGYTGYLHWGLNHHRGEPFTRSVTEHPALPDNDSSALPAGDTHVVYPGPDGPWSSTRFEAHRIGMEDYEFLLMLRRKNEQMYETITGDIFTDAKTYEKRVEAYRAARQKILKELS